MIFLFYLNNFKVIYQEVTKEMKIESNLAISDINGYLSIVKKVELNKASIIASIESKRVGLISLSKKDSVWTIDKFYSDRSYDKNGQLSRKLFNSMEELSIQGGIRPVDNLEDILNYMEKD